MKETRIMLYVPEGMKKEEFLELQPPINTKQEFGLLLIGTGYRAAYIRKSWKVYII